MSDGAGKVLGGGGVAVGVGAGVGGGVGGGVPRRTVMVALRVVSKKAVMVTVVFAETENVVRV